MVSSIKLRVNIIKFLYKDVYANFPKRESISISQMARCPVYNRAKTIERKECI